MPDRDGFGLVKVDETWAAVSVPCDWAPIVRAVLGSRGGPVYCDATTSHWVWPVPAGGAAGWPDLLRLGVPRYGPGELLLIPGKTGHNGTAWVHPPTAERAFTHPVLLREALEFVLGPLDEAVNLGPVVVCRSCGAPIRDAVLIESFESPSGPGWDWYACRPCHQEMLRGGPGRHLHIVRKGAR